MCQVHISLRVALSENLLKSKPGVYFSEDTLADYCTEQTGSEVKQTNIKSTLNRILANGLTAIHRRNNTVCFETEEIRAARLAEEANIWEAKAFAQSEKDVAVWAKKRARVQDLEVLLKDAKADFKAYEDKRQDSILRIVA